MSVLNLPANANQITATTTATSLQDLIKATSGNSEYVIPAQFNSVTLNSEGNIRFDIGLDPTTSVGKRLTTGGTWNIEKIDLSKLNIIAESGTVKINITIYRSTL